MSEGRRHSLASARGRASHTAKLKELGATREAIAETVFITSALRARAAYIHALVALDFFERADPTS